MAHKRYQSGQHKHPWTHIYETIHPTSVTRSWHFVHTGNLDSSHSYTTTASRIQPNRGTKKKGIQRRNCNVYQEITSHHTNARKWILPVCKTNAPKQLTCQHNKCIPTTDPILEKKRHHRSPRHCPNWRHHRPIPAPAYYYYMRRFQRQGRNTDAPARHPAPPQNSKWHAHLPQSKVVITTMYEILIIHT